MLPLDIAPESHAGPQDLPAVGPARESRTRDRVWTFLVVLVSGAAIVAAYILGLQ